MPTGTSGPTCAHLISSPESASGTKANEAEAAYRTACLLKKAGLDGDGLRAVAEKAAEIDPTFSPPSDLLAAARTSWLVARSRSISDSALALATIAGVVAALVIGLLFAGTMVFRATLGRSRTLRNLMRFRPSVIVEPTVAGATKELKTLPSLLQSVLGNLGTDIGGQSIQFVSPSSDDVSEVVLSASAPPQLEYLTWVMALLRPLAPKDRVTLRLTVQPEGRQGLGLTATLVGGHKGRTINATTLWEAEMGLGGIATDEPLLGERERYQLLVAPLAAWAYFTLADLTQRDEQLVGTRNWRSYGLFTLGCRLYKTHRQRGQRLLRDAIDADPSNLGAQLNILLLEFDSRRTAAGKEQLERLLFEVEELPNKKLCSWTVANDRRDYWYDPTWYRTMYSLTAVYTHMVSAEANSRDRRPTADQTKRLREKGAAVALELIGACRTALGDLLGPDGQPEPARKIRGRKRRLRYRRRQELALFLGQMLPSSVLLLVNLRLLDRSKPVVAALSPGSEDRAAGPPDHRRREWNRRSRVLGAIDPRSVHALGCPTNAELLGAIDPVEFLPARARYNVACVHSEVAQYLDPTQPDYDDQAKMSREVALQELEKGLDHDSAQWAREDPALWEVRRNHATRPRFAELVAEILCTPIEWSILAELPFIGVAGASRLWIGGTIKTAESLRKLGEPSRRAEREALLDNPSDDAWLVTDELTSWIRRAGLRAHLRPRLDDADLVDRIERLLHGLGIATSAELSSVPPWPLARKLVDLAPADFQHAGMLTPAAVEVWAR